MKGCRFAGEGAEWFRPDPECKRDAAGEAHPSDRPALASADRSCAGHGMRAADPHAGIDGGAERLGWSLPVLPVGLRLAAELLGDWFYYYFNSFFNLVFLSAALSLTH